MKEIDHIIVGNAPRIPCTIRTLKSFWQTGGLPPMTHIGELLDAVQYLALRAGFSEDRISALKELHDDLSSSLKEMPVQEKGTAKENGTNAA